MRGEFFLFAMFVIQGVLVVFGQFDSEIAKASAEIEFAMYSLGFGLAMAIREHK